MDRLSPSTNNRLFYLPVLSQVYIETDLPPMLLPLVWLQHLWHTFSSIVILFEYLLLTLWLDKSPYQEPLNACRILNLPQNFLFLHVWEFWSLTWTLNIPVSDKTSIFQHQVALKLRVKHFSQTMSEHLRLNKSCKVQLFLSPLSCREEHLPLVITHAA